MAYELHIEKETGDISVSDWITAVGKVGGIKFDGSPKIARNPKTSELIMIGGSPNNVSVKHIEKVAFGLIKKEVWITSIYFSGGKASFKATEAIEHNQNPIRVAVAGLAKILDAKIIGDEGEEYKW